MQPVSATAIVTLSLFAVITSFEAVAVAKTADQKRTVGRTKHSAELSRSDWNAIRQEYERNRHAAFAIAGGYQARNHGQRWMTRFDGWGFEIEPEDGNWTWGLQLKSYGRPGRQRSLARPRVTAARERVSYDWGAGLQEWWINDPRGLEHGFTIQERLPEDGDGLVLRLASRGGLQPRVQEDGAGVIFVDESGRPVVNYTGLRVWDADRRTLTARMRTVGTVVQVEVDERSARYPLTIDPIAQQAYLKASNTGGASDPFGGGDEFGFSAAVSGDTVVVGAPFEDSSATGVNGNQSDNSAFGSGAAYIFVRNGGVWTQQAYLKSSNTGVDDQFGFSVAVSGDTVVVGAWTEGSSATGVNGNQSDNSAFGSGAAYVFVRNGGVWTQQAYLKASNTGTLDDFGFSVAVSGETVVVGAFAEDSNATGVNGNQTGNSAEASGAAYVFVRNGGVWTQQAYLKASNTGVGDQFGRSVAVSGDTVVVGAYSEDSNATGVNGNQSDNSAEYSGAAYVFVRNAGVWTQQAYLKASNTRSDGVGGVVITGDAFGWSVAVSDDTVVVGAPFEDSSATEVNGNQDDNTGEQTGAAYVFVRNAGAWAQQAYLKAAERVEYFGYSVGVSANAVVAGAPYAFSGSGAAYLFLRNDGVWTQQGDLKASSMDRDLLGSSVAVWGDMVIVGSPEEDSNATGVNGNQSDNSARDSGAALVFAVPSFETALSRIQGSEQSAPIGQQFAQRLEVRLVSASGGRVANVPVTFTAPASVASGTFPTGAVAMVNTNSQGMAIAPVFTANMTAGTYRIAVTAPYALPTEFVLTNAPVVSSDSVTPNAGAGMSGVFTFRYSHISGYSNLRQVFGYFNSSAFGSEACGVYYLRDNNGLYLKNETDDGWLGPLRPGAAGSLTNSRCTLNAAGSSVSGSGNTLSLTVALAFKLAFTGVKGIYMYAIDNAGIRTPTHEQRGAWTVIGPTSDSVTPSSGSGAFGIFTFRYSSVGGHTHLRQVFGALNGAAFGAQGCNTMYLRDNNGLYLNNDTGDGWLGPLTPGSAASVSNSRCTLYPVRSSVSGSGNTLTLSVALTFKPAFAGLKGIYLYAIDSAGLTTPTSEQRGTWMVTAGP